MSDFSTRVILWQRKHGRHGLPWQGADAYRVWLSEIMLQQTQVATVIPYYQRFVASFPSVSALAAASMDEVLAHWSGLGYYARGRNLHRAAQIIADKHQGEFPREFEQILDLPGIGRSTAAAICALAYHERRAILDGNVKRVLARYCGISGSTIDKKIEEQMWQQAELLLPKDQSPRPARVRGGLDSSISTYTQALMDMGATICTRSKPKCELCPVHSDCVALQSNRVAVLPPPRARKTVPEKHTTFLLLLHGNDILLEKRPPQGIWGGMWCLPQIEDGSGVVDDYLQIAGMEVSERIELEEFTHTFTHFKLHIVPVLLRVACKPDQVQQGGSEWMDLQEALRAGIPAPVRSLLQKLQS
ncbi:MAG: A/G-specific adenine glycosylase [Gallionellales bacterium 35-53-114]|jgi:A/G-specific adenine glycosylase|nr:MAG: A/G-specific adenine glycosylase [Gallionellales bacterium 35-53-114]OYZ63787.1 MAG: A/G-specific adenine glycosylase [Gallionellales bacterium 24-53-125]OZB09380.1 MAG: A/G-specific adenine glycosylase [Gallionellales bacterium 39-52-133]HQS57963.1 A/G-specific adenine glycosylase [Gallionellaceae bacterium]HQS76124.1 A/G-specific adenine glycosylase [Gallionellaceae bacterium]